MSFQIPPSKSGAERFFKFGFPELLFETFWDSAKILFLKSCSKRLSYTKSKVIFL